MKKLLFLLLALSLVLALTACGEEAKPEIEPEVAPVEEIVDTPIDETEGGLIEDGAVEYEDPFAGYTSDFLQSKEGTVFQTLYHHYKANSEWIEEENDFAVKNVTNPRIKIYSQEEIDANPDMFASHNLNEGDIPFEATVDLEVSDKLSGDELFVFTAGTGEIDGHTIKDKYQCGILRSYEGTYVLDLVGTSF